MQIEHLSETLAAEDGPPDTVTVGTYTDLIESYAVAINREWSEPFDEVEPLVFYAAPDVVQGAYALGRELLADHDGSVPWETFLDALGDHFGECGEWLEFAPDVVLIDKDDELADHVCGYGPWFVGEDEGIGVELVQNRREYTYVALLGPGALPGQVAAFARAAIFNDYLDNPMWWVQINFDRPGG